VILYFLTGIGSALANIPVVALVAGWFDGAGRGKAIGLCVMGNGFGILLSGKLVPWFNQFEAGWRIGWIVFGMVVAVVFVICSVLLKNRPKDTNSTSRAFPQPHSGMGNRSETLVFLHCGAIYFLFGFSYVVFITFFVTSLVQDHGFSQLAAGQIWGGIGMLSIVSGPLFGYISDLWGRKPALSLVFLIQIVSYLLIAVPPFHFAIYLSAACFALVAWSIPSIMAALVGDLAGAERTAAVFGFITFLFGVGQIAGPACAGYLAEKAGNFSGSFLMIAVCSAVAAILSLLLPGPEKKATATAAR
jgi:MFS family permease